MGAGVGGIENIMTKEKVLLNVMIIYCKLAETSFWIGVEKCLLI